ncbi:ABC transporter permease [Bradyrhizobium diazoefficiens]|nr:ABC transporter permease [Bradyrhizobium diazoefficiens]MBR0848962.1 ABC transporter permease [Bradyrhizobium diazoefficiens]
MSDSASGSWGIEMASFDDADRSLSDLRNVVLQSAIWSSLAYADIRSRYRLSTFGSLWITLTTGAMSLGIGLFYGQFFGQDMHKYLPYFTASFITWTFISSVIGEASTTLIGAGNLIKSSSMPIVFHVLRMLQRNFIIVLHNAIVMILIWPFVQWQLYPSALLSAGGLVLVYLFLTGVSVVVAVVCVRYRDVPPLIQVVIQFLFLLTPIIWYPEQIKFGTEILLLNPFSYMLMIVRDPILGRPVEMQTWIIAISLAAMSLFAGSLMYVRFRRRIAYWV